MKHKVRQPSTALLRLVNGFQVSQAIHVAATLGIADCLKDGPRSSDQLAVAIHAHPRSLHRLLRALASVGVLSREGEDHFSLTPLGECLCTDAPEPVGPWAAFIGRPHHWHAWGHLGESVRTGECAARLAHGMSPWEYRAQHPEEGAIFDAAMSGATRRQSAAVLAALDVGRSSCVVDVGGGQGTFLAELLSRHPAARGVLFDQPQVVARADAILRGAGVAHRCQVIAGSFFESVPAGGDVYVLKHIIHDWEDEPAIAILRACRRAMRPASRLLVVEQVIEPLDDDPVAAFRDLLMLVGPGGRERTSREFAALFASAGLDLISVTATARELSVIEALPATAA